MSGLQRAFFAWLLRHRALGALTVLAITLVLGWFAAQVQPDFSIEQLFPVHDEARETYDRFKEDFPHEDAVAVVIVEADDLWTAEGVARVAALEDDLGRIDGVIDTAGLATIRDIVLDDDGWISIERLVPRGDRSPEVLAARRVAATTDPLFAWRLAPPPPPDGPTLEARGPDAGASTVRVTLHQAHAASEARRARFLAAAREVVAAHDAAAREAGLAQRLTLTGMPVLRPEYNELINGDMARLMPIALGIILALLLVVFRSLAITASAVIVVALSIIWTYGAMGLLGVPLQTLTSVTPLVVTIISISDTVHIVTHYKLAIRGAHRGDRRGAIVAALEETALPCLITQVVIACGFLALLTVQIQAIWQFGLVTALGVMLTWLANVLVVPLCLDVLRPRAEAEAADTLALRAFERPIAWAGAAVRRHPRRIVVGSAAAVALAALAGTQASAVYYLFDNLKPDHRIARTIDYGSAIHGGLVTLAVYIEPPERAAGDERPEAMLDPEAIALMDRVAAFLEERFPELKTASSAADLWRKTLALFSPELAAAQPRGLPDSRGQAAQLLTLFDDPQLVRDLLSHDRQSAAVVAMVPNIDSTRARAMAAEIDAYLAEEERATGYRVSLTGLFGLVDEIYHLLVGGLAMSLGLAILVSLLTLSLVLGSWRIGLAALVPNLIPVVMVLGFMGLSGVTIKPTTVILFAITITIAADDTVQLLARFRLRLARRQAEGVADAYRVAVYEALHEAGLAILITTVIVAVGFLVLVGSSFLGLVHLGALIAVSLVAAVLADVLLLPVLLLRFGPGGARPQKSPPWT